ncbi:hypothetical protein BVRB_2g035160 [Beta vulgaris subsp. vulgaris]|uniref:uncharacterized protein LOC104886704 n=1 Tax=Beta vulgaris subsp. vulgaris TaxID=3555 RepID=UPI00053FC5F2|nr:uncharacterized protein LOC104886704 [Beta vulgaris subsp. vulgaris]KMT17768.1 hypothetical protein BVRB_2g035160 [Beta vulgaris subsp. vulgaris]
MDSPKNSNKISDIVRLKQMLKKWRKQAHNNTSNTSNNNNNTSNSNNAKKGSLSRSNSVKGITFLKRTLSFTDLSANNGVPSNNNNSNSNAKKGISFLKRTLSFTDLSGSNNNNNGGAISSNAAVPKGFLAVHVGEEMKRFIIPTNYLRHQAFSVLLKEAEDEFGFQQEGVLRIPCEVEVFESMLKMVDEKNNVLAKQSLKFTRIDGNGIVCGSIENQSLSQSHQPPSPMCR